MRAKDDGALGQKLLQWEQKMVHKWGSVHIGKVDTQTKDNQHLFRVEVFSGEIQPKDLSVALYAEITSSDAASLIQMSTCKDCSSPGRWIYSVKVPAGRSLGDYTPRVTPAIPDAFLPIESAQILWQR